MAASPTAQVAPSVRYSGSDDPGSWQGLSGSMLGIGTGPSFPGHELFGIFGPAPPETPRDPKSSYQPAGCVFSMVWCASWSVCGPYQERQ